MLNGSQNFVAEAAVVGGGPAGLVSALALAEAGIETVLVAPPAAADNRTTALLASSVAALETLGVWEACRPHAAPLKTMRIVDATSRLLRAPEVIFSAAEIGLDAFGYNIENLYLIAALEVRVGALKLVRIVAPAHLVESDETGVTIRHADGEIRARLVVGADGARSLCRAAAGVGTTQRRYPQTALTLNLAHDRPHNGITTEFHTETGPFTLVPLPGLCSSLVWVVGPEEAAALAAMPDDALAIEAERRAHSLLGKMRVKPGRGVFPLMIETADTFARNRIALVGEAAHVVPPIGAQGLNLGLRDAATIAEIVADAQRQGDDVGGDDVLGRYDTARRLDVTSRSIAIDMLNRSLISGFLPIHGARGLSLYLADRIGPLRRALMREGVMPIASQPRLMRGETV